MNLVKWFRKNNKKIMAVVVIVIMFGFVGGSALQRLLQGKGTAMDKTVAYFKDANKVTNYDLALAQRELEILRMINANVMLRSIWGPIFRTLDLKALLLGELMFAERTTSATLSGHIKQLIARNEYRISDKQINDIYRRSMPSNIYWLRLKTEAERAGIRVPNDSAGRELARIISKITGGATYSQVIGAIVNRQGIPESEVLTTFGKLLAVLEYSRTICSDEDVTTQQIRHGISWGGETIDVEFVRFDSSVFSEAQDEPTEQEISAHFEKYKTFFAGAISDENPYGFGYRLADRAQLEYIAVELDDVSEIVAIPTQEEAEEYYRKHRDEFIEQVLSDPNDPNSLTERTKSYAEVARNISNMLLRNKKNSKAEQIMQEAKSLTEAGFEQIDMEPSELSAEEFRQMAGDYETAAEELGKKYKIEVYSGQTGLLNAADMWADEHLGRLYIKGSGETLVGLPQIVLAIDELEGSELGPFDVPKPRVYENIGPMKDVTEQIMAIVRVTKAEKASVPESINETFSKSMLKLGQSEEQASEEVYSVREKVVEDLKKLAAMDTTKNKAEEFKILVAKDGWDGAIDKFNELHGKTRENEDDPNDPNAFGSPEAINSVRKPFELQDLTSLGRISRMRLAALAARKAGTPEALFSVNTAKKEGRLRDRLYCLVPPDSNSLETVPLIVEFKPDMNYYCIKSLSVKRISQDEYERAKALEAYKEDIVQSQSLAALHFNPENILKRMNFRWAEAEMQGGAPASQKENKTGVPADFNTPVEGGGES